VLKCKCPCSPRSQRCYNFVVVGVTGAGKTTLINAFINFLMGVGYKTKFRYKLIDESEILRGVVKS